MPQHTDVFIVGGLGHIGLPFGLVLADAGLRVVLYDIDESKRALVDEGQMPFLEQGAEAVLQRVIGRTLHTTNDLDEVSAADCVVITIGTPVDEYLNPKMLPMLALAEQLSSRLRPGQHVMLRSTVYPGTSQRIADLFADRGAPIDLSFCPERIVQGQALREMGRFPQIISGCTEEARREAGALFRKLGIQTIEVQVQEAELAKLFTNSWRYIQFATANQFYMIATEHGANFDRIYHAMTSGYERARSFPTPGFSAGPCLLKDTLQLAAFHQNHFQLGHAAMLVNEGLPSFIVEHLKRSGVNLAQSRVGILGMAFKADTDDTRDSLAYKLGKILRFHGASVEYSDVYVQDPTFSSVDDLLSRCQVVIIGAPHAAYRSLHVPSTTHLVDLWNIVGKQSHVLPREPREPQRIAWWTPLMGEREKELISQVIDCNFPNDGPLTAAFEQRVAALCGTPYAVAVTSGTAAIFVALAACDIGPGDEVIVPDIGFIAAANAVRLTGAIPVLVDVDPTSLCIDPGQVEAAITPRTRAILAVHLSGRAANMPALLALARRHDLRLVEDAAEALGSRCYDAALGSIGDLGCFSFTANKTITTGQGGMVVTSDARLYHRLRELKDQGRPVRGTGGADLHMSVGYNFKFTDLQAAMGLAQLETFAGRRAHLRHVFSQYKEYLQHNPRLRLPGYDLDAGECPQWVDAVVDDRDGLHDYLLERQIETRKFWYPMHTQPPYRSCDDRFPASTAISASALWLPTSLTLTDDDIRLVCRRIGDWTGR